MSFKTTQRCCYAGYVVQAVSINFLPLLFVIFQNEYNLSYALIGTLISVNFLTQLAVDIMSVFFLERISYRKSAVTAQLLCFIGFVLLSFLPNIMDPFLGICICVVLYSIGAGLIEVVINPIISGLPKDCGGNFVLTHSFYCWGQLAAVLLTTVALRIFGDSSWGIIALLWAVIPLVNGLVFMKTPIAPPLPPQKRESILKLLKDKTFLLLLALMVCAGGSELAMAQWASTFAQNALGVDKMLGDLLGPCLFAFFMGMGRLFYGLYEDKLNFKLCAVLSNALCVLCYICAAVSKNPFLSLAGCSLCGLAISTLWPGTLEVAEKKFPRGGGAMYSALAIFGDVGCSVAPFITGAVASISVLGENALRMGLLVNIVYPIGFIIIIRNLLSK
ncbi:MAG: MFS transporter [Clostridia bacterium]|nr:MFS transporter [Clostridia bacterium]